MKKIALFLFFALTVFSAGQAQAGNKYVIDRNHANVTWFVNHFGLSNVSGTFSDVQGTLFFDKGMPTSSMLDVTVKTTSLQTAVPKLTQNLKGPDFFNVENFPEARFVSTEIKIVGKDTANVVGNLTLNGKMKPVTFKATFNKEGDGPGGKHEVGFSLTGKIKRSDFDMKFGLPDIGDDVELRIEVEAINEEDMMMEIR